MRAGGLTSAGHPSTGQASKQASGCGPLTQGRSASGGCSGGWSCRCTGPPSARPGPCWRSACSCRRGRGRGRAGGQGHKGTGWVSGGARGQLSAHSTRHGWHGTRPGHISHHPTTPDHSPPVGEGAHVAGQHVLGAHRVPAVAQAVVLLDAPLHGVVLNGRVRAVVGAVMATLLVGAAAGAVGWQHRGVVRRRAADGQRGQGAPRGGGGGGGGRQRPCARCSRPVRHSGSVNSAQIAPKQRRARSMRVASPPHNKQRRTPHYRAIKSPNSACQGRRSAAERRQHQTAAAAAAQHRT